MLLYKILFKTKYNVICISVQLRIICFLFHEKNFFVKIYVYYFIKILKILNKKEIKDI